MVMLHSGRSVQLGQAGRALLLEGVVGASVVEIVAQTRDHQRKTFNLEQNNKNIIKIKNFYSKNNV
jgi:hypothetical protein